MSILTKEQFLSEYKRIEENNMTLEDYIKTVRLGTDFPMNRAMKKEVYASYVYNKENKLKYDSQMFDKEVAIKGLSQNGMIAYNAICRYRDEVMYLDA